MNKNHSGITKPFFSLTGFQFCKIFVELLVVCITILLVPSGALHASPLAFPASKKPKDLLVNLLSGEWDAKHNAVKWKANPGDIQEFNAELSDETILYSFIDTTFEIKSGAELQYVVVIRTAPMMTNEEGEFVNANSCHVCGVNMGYFTYTKDNDSIYVNKFKRNFATHGSFGSQSYTLSLINLGAGYELLRVDDPYEGMGVTSVATRFYQDGELVLSMISKENNQGNRQKSQKGYYEFRTSFTYDHKTQTIIASQTGYKIDENSGKKIVTNKTKKWVYDGYTLQF